MAVVTTTGDNACRNAPSRFSRARSAGRRDGTSRIPFQAYTDEAVYRKELDRFFYRDHWCYVGLEAEIPNPGDFKRTVVGERSVIMVRDKDGAIHVVENVCAHRGMAFCRERHGNRESFTCPYHQWNYTLAGDLQGVPFRRGVKQDGKVNGGMPADFKPADHGLTKLKVGARAAASSSRRSTLTSSRSRTTSARRSSATSTACSTAASSRSSATTASAFRATGS